MVALVNAYATVEQLRTHMKDENATADVEMLIRALNTASRNIDEFCGGKGRKFWLDPTVTVRKYRCEDPEMAWVDDIGSTSGLIVATDPLDDGTFSETWTIDTDFELEPEDANQQASAYAWYRIRAIGDKLFPTTGRRRRLQVTALHGWSSVPPDIEQACLIRAYALYKRRESFNGYAGLTDFGPARTIKFDPDVMALLQPFSKVYIGSVG